MSAGDLLGWLLGAVVLSAFAGLLGWAARKTKADREAFHEALARRGWTVPPGDQSAPDDEQLLARGAHGGRGFLATTHTTRGKHSRTMTRIRVKSGLTQGRVVVCPTVPDEGILGVAMSLLFGGQLPPAWEGAPASLSGKWQVRGPAELAAQVASPALVEALVRWDRNGGVPWLELAGGTLVLNWQSGGVNEARLVALVELAVAASGPPPA